MAGEVEIGAADVAPGLGGAAGVAGAGTVVEDLVGLVSGPVALEEEGFQGGGGEVVDVAGVDVEEAGFGFGALLVSGVV